jgi:hypothetical protein
LLVRFFPKEKVEFIDIKLQRFKGVFSFQQASGDAPFHTGAERV